MDMGIFVSDATFKMSRSMAINIVKTHEKGVKGPTNGVTAMAKAVKLADRDSLRLINSRLAGEMNHRVRQSVAGISARSQQYRENQGRLTGGLRRAVRDEDFTKSDEHGIYYANLSVLNKYAKHWGRLNFGTKGGAAITPPGVFRLRIDNRVMGAQIGFRDGPREGFSLPAGFFSQNGDMVAPDRSYRGKSTGNPFFPGTLTKVKTVTRGGPGPRKTAMIRKRVPTVGIKSTNFLDAGLRALEKEFPKKFGKFLEEQIEQGTKAGRAAAAATR